MTSEGLESRPSQSSLLAVLAILFSRWRLVLAPVVALVGLAALAYAAALRNRYEATSVIMPTSQSGGVNRLSGIAAQLGLSVPLGDEGEPLPFYAQLIESREVLLELAQSEYQHRGAAARPVIELLDVGADDNEREYHLKGIETLRDRIDVSTDMNAGTVVIKTVADDPDFAEFMNRRILELINAFNLERRRNQASEEMRFTEERLQAARQELEQAEAAVERFLEQNRTYEQSPQLRFEFSRLQRRLDLRQQVYISLAEAHEQARIEAVRNTPVITIVDSPEGSAEQLASLPALMLGAAILGLVAGIAIAFFTEYWHERKQSHPEEYARLREAVTEAARALPARSRRQAPDVE